MAISGEGECDQGDQSHSIGGHRCRNGIHAVDQPARKQHEAPEGERPSREKDGEGVAGCVMSDGGYHDHREDRISQQGDDLAAEKQAKPGMAQYAKIVSHW